MGIGIRGYKDAGFTIFETMIVLAVTAALFAVIAVTLGGRQNDAEFTHAIQDVQSQIQQVINQVSAGFYPNTQDFQCASNGNSIIISNGSNQQGTNQGCVFLGKVIQFDVNNTDPEEYMVYTIAACNPSPLVGCATPPVPSDFTAVDPQIVNFQYTSTTGMLEYGLTTYPLSAVNSIGTSLGAVGFLMELGNLNSASGNYNSGTQQVDLVTIGNTSTGLSSANAIKTINDSLDTNQYTVDPSSGVQVCFVSNGTDQSGLITIGGSGRQLLAELQIKSNRTCSS